MSAITSHIKEFCNRVIDLSTLSDLLSEYVWEDEDLGLLQKEKDLLWLVELGLCEYDQGHVTEEQLRVEFLLELQK